MSAFVVSRDHIDRIVSLAVHGPAPDGWEPGFGVVWSHGPDSHRATAHTADDIGQALLDANVASVAYRYPDTPDDLPGHVPTVDSYELLPFRWSGHVRPPDAPGIAEGFKLMDCLEYQSCERPDWEASEAFAIVSAIRRNLWHRLPGYDEAPWDYSREAVAA